MNLSRKDIFDLVYGLTSGGRRFTQDSPVLPDVWLEFGLHPGAARDLLLTPFSIRDVRTPPGELARIVAKRLKDDRKRRGKTPPPRGMGSAIAAEPDLGIGISFNQSTVVAHMTFEEMCHCILPLSKWWSDRICRDVTTGDKRPSSGRRGAVAARRGKPALLWSARDFGVRLRENQAKIAQRLPDFVNFRGELPERPEMLWLVQLVGAIGLGDSSGGVERGRTEHDFLEIVAKAADVFDGVPLEPNDPVVYSVSLNRRVKLAAKARRGAKPAAFGARTASADAAGDPGPIASPASVASIKADAAIRLFALTCSDQTWAIVDSGIDATHPCFRKRDTEQGSKLFEHPFVRENGKWKNHTRVVATYDFTLLRRIMTDDEDDFEKLPERIKKRMREERGRIRSSLLSGNELDWTLLAPLLNVPHDHTYRNDNEKHTADDYVPKLEHGTHVAGLLGGDWRAKDIAVSLRPDPAVGNQPFEVPVEPPAGGFAGVCPDINLYDLRILNEHGIGDEFTVMAALQFVRYLNSHQDYPTINGVNLSVSIPHEVANYACGRTPVCEECERVVAIGTIVVAAAGNDGYLHYATTAGEARGYEGYQTVSITDPGNAASVITVGATHREAPHTYGVSYFSSRGPTGDGRSKPDLVAPGEKINGPTPNGGMRWLDGTSMAAPHVSGAAALVIARHRELADVPGRIKEILTTAATDLGRERYFQGAGMLDVLRAIQSV